MISILGVPLVVVIIFLNSVIGRFVTKRWLPVTAIALGIVITVLVKRDIGAVLEGVIYGGLAMGAFDLGTKALFPKKDETAKE